MKQLPTQYPFEAYADTRQGGRAENQDTYASVDTPFGMLILVCDGMGGGPSGKAASVLAAKAITQYIMEQSGRPERKQLLRDAILFANDAILEAVHKNPASRGMGTTVTALLINEQSAVVAHVGDSRVYQFRGRRKVFRTEDHSLVFERVRMKQMTEEEARTAENSNIITQAVGSANGIRPDVVELPYEKGDRFMLCSDGIWGTFPEPELIRMAAGPKSLTGALDGLVVRVDECGFSNGGRHDNLTAAFLQTTKSSILKEKMSTKQRYLFIAVSAVCLASLVANVVLYSKLPKTKDAAGGETPEVTAPASAVAGEEQFSDQTAKLSESVPQTAADDARESAAAADAKTAEPGLPERLDGFVAELKTLQKLAAGDEKDRKVDAAKNRFADWGEELVQAGADRTAVEEIGSLLGYPIAKRDGDTTEGHYGTIIKKINEIKNTLKK